MIRNIIFDIGNVLVSFDWKTYLKGFGFPAAEEQAIARAVFMSPDWNEVDRGVLTPSEIEARFVEAAPQYCDDIQRVFRNAEQCISRRDYAIPWIEELKQQGYRIYYLSNYGEHIRRQTEARVLDFLPHMDGGLFSYEVQLIKPDPRIFHAFLQRYPQINPEESVFFDDSPANVEAAANLDFQAILFRSQEQAKRAFHYLSTC